MSRRQDGALVDEDATRETVAHHGDRLALERMVLFTDAVFAIVITLMAIEIQLPHHPADGWTNAALLQALAELAPKLLAYVISFLVVALFWTGHLRRYRYVRAIDNRLLWLNLAQLLFMGLLPFFTALLAESLGSLSITLYAGNLAASGLFGLLAWRHASGDPKLALPELSARLRRTELILAAAVVGVFAASMAIAWWQPLLAMLSWLLLGLATLVVRTRP